MWPMSYDNEFIVAIANLQSVYKNNITTMERISKMWAACLVMMLAMGAVSCSSSDDKPEVIPIKFFF